MAFQSFTSQDFDVFSIPGLEDRMDGIITYVRPKLEQLGQYFAPILSSFTGEEMFAHVAKHARRTKNPPDDTWVAFAPNKRGYKKLPHFQIGLWGSHLFVYFAVIYENPYKEQIGQAFTTNLKQIVDTIPSHYVWSSDHTVPYANVHKELTEDDLRQLFERLMNVKKAEILCGIHLSKEKVLNMSGNELLQTIENTFKTLLPLYQLANSPNEVEV
jgi:uncharacterized protein YktB (UPF0637 family)